MTIVFMLYNILDIRAISNIIAITKSVVFMNSLIFLGIIPGTNIQINFYGWLTIFLTLTVAIFSFVFKKYLFIEIFPRRNKRSVLLASQFHIGPTIFY